MGYFEYVRPSTLENACSQLAEDGAKVLAGGTDLIPRIQQEVVTPRKVVDIGAINDLTQVKNGTDTLFIGSMVKLADLCADRYLAEKFPAVTDAARRVASPQIRNIGTVGGNICQYTRCQYFNQSFKWRSNAEPCFKMGGNICYQQRKSKVCVAPLYSDLVPALVALNAVVHIVGCDGSRKTPLENLYRINGDLNLSRGEIVAGIELNVPVINTGQAFRKSSLRGHIDFGMGIVCAVLQLDTERDVCLKASIVLGAVAPYPVRAKVAEDLLIGQRITPNAIEEAAKVALEGVTMVAEPNCSPGYKRHLLSVLIRRAVSGAVEVA